MWWWCLSLALPNGNETKILSTWCRAHLRLTKRNTQPPTRTPRGRRSEGKQERNKSSSRDKKVTTKEKRFRSFFFSRLVCVCWCKNGAEVHNFSRVSRRDVFSKGHLIRYLTTSRAHQSVVFPLRFTGFLVFLRVVLRQVLVVQNF